MNIDNDADNGFYMAEFRMDVKSGKSEMTVIDDKYNIEFLLGFGMTFQVDSAGLRQLQLWTHHMVEAACSEDMSSMIYLRRRQAKSSCILKEM